MVMAVAGMAHYGTGTLRNNDKRDRAQSDYRGRP